MYKGRAGVTRDFVATGIVAIEDRVVLVFHKKLRRWLPPGGHIDAPELPDQAAIREVKEETGELSLLFMLTYALPICYIFSEISHFFT